MGKRINIMLPDQTVRVLDRVVARGNRSRFISEAVLNYVKTQSTANLRERLKAGALSNSRLDLEIAEEWFPVEQKAWQRLEREERASKPPRAEGRSISRRSTRRSGAK